MVYLFVLCNGLPKLILQHQLSTLELSWRYGELEEVPVGYRYIEEILRELDPWRGIMIATTKAKRVNLSIEEVWKLKISLMYIIGLYLSPFWHWTYSFTGTYLISFISLRMLNLRLSTGVWVALVSFLGWPMKLVDLEQKEDDEHLIVGLEKEKKRRGWSPRTIKKNCGKKAHRKDNENATRKEEHSSPLNLIMSATSSEFHNAIDVNYLIRTKVGRSKK